MPRKKPEKKSGRKPKAKSNPAPAPPAAPRLVEEPADDLARALLEALERYEAKHGPDPRVRRWVEKLIAGDPPDYDPSLRPPPAP